MKTIIKFGFYFLFFPFFAHCQTLIDMKNEPATRCELFFSSGCFTVSQRDIVKMEIVTDFVLYDIKFATGDSARVYVGFNPSMIKNESNQYKKCDFENSFLECKVRVLNDDRLEFLARKNSSSEFIHVISERASKSSQQLIRSIRACSRNANGLECS